MRDASRLGANETACTPFSAERSVPHPAHSVCDDQVQMTRLTCDTGKPPAYGAWRRWLILPFIDQSMGMGECMDGIVLQLTEELLGRCTSCYGVGTGLLTGVGVTMMMGVGPKAGGVGSRARITNTNRTAPKRKRIAPLILPEQKAAEILLIGAVADVMHDVWLEALERLLHTLECDDILDQEV